VRSGMSSIAEEVATFTWSISNLFLLSSEGLLSVHVDLLGQYSYHVFLAPVTVGRA